MDFFSFSTLKYTKSRRRGLSQTVEMLRLTLLLSLAVTLTLVISDNNAVAGVLFQSPASPPVLPLPAELAPSQPPAETAPGRLPAEGGAGQPPAEGAPGQPLLQPGTEFVSPLLPFPVQQPGNEPSALEPSLQSESPRSERTDRLSDEEDPEDGGSRNFILDRSELVDSVIVSTAYVWLCCGIMLLLLVPLVFLFLQIRGRTKMMSEDNF